MSSSIPISKLVTAGKKPFIAVCGASGVGKTAFVEALLAQCGGILARASSYTTRARRLGEGNAEYQFISDAEFEKLWSSGALVNDDFFFGNRYGIDKTSLDALLDGRTVPVKEIAPKNVTRLLQAGYAPIAVMVESGETYGRSNRPIELDRTELGTFAVEGIAVCKLPRDAGSPSAMAFLFRDWLDAGLLLFEPDDFYRVHSLSWDGDNSVGYDAIAPEFTDDKRVTTAFFHQLSEKFWHAVNEMHVVNEEEYLEVAPGRGWLFEKMEKLQRSRYRGLELSKEMAHLNPQGALIDVGSATAMPYAENRFAGVLGSLVDPFLNASFLCEARRVLAPGGWLAFTTPSAEWAGSLRSGGQLRSTTFVDSSGVSTSVGSACVGRSELEQALVRLGFEEVAVDSMFVDRSTSSALLPPAVLKALNGFQGPALEVVVGCFARKAQ
jgi:Guanylate kinase/Methyltransferase domain